MTRSYKQGYFKPRHPEKYIGNIDNIFYRSSWELRVMQFYDNNPNILKWVSEEIVIPYINKIDNSWHRYIPDFLIEYRDRRGKIRMELIEVKPSSQTKSSRSRKGNRKLLENLEYARNIYKWKAAVKWCEKHGVTFKVITEKEIFL